MNNVKWGQSSIHGWEMSGSALPAIISGHGGWIPVSRTWQASTTVRHKYAVRLNLMVMIHDTILRQRRHFKYEKIMNSTTLPLFLFGINGQGFIAARLTWQTYVDGRELENSSV